jgi:hypothetical protein
MMDNTGYPPCPACGSTVRVWCEWAGRPMCGGKCTYDPDGDPFVHATGGIVRVEHAWGTLTLDPGQAAAVGQMLVEIAEDLVQPETPEEAEIARRKALEAAEQVRTHLIANNILCVAIGVGLLASVLWLAFRGL